MTDYLQSVYKKLKYLKSNFTLEELNKIIYWIESSRSLQYHRLMFSFFRYCWQQTHIEDWDTFMEVLKYHNNFCTRKVIETGNKVKILIKFKSLEFGKCSQRDFKKFSESVIQYAKIEWKIDFTLWEHAYKSNPELI